MSFEKWINNSRARHVHTGDYYDYIESVDEKNIDSIKVDDYGSSQTVILHEKFEGELWDAGTKGRAYIKSNFNLQDLLCQKRQIFL